MHLNIKWFPQKITNSLSPSYAIKGKLPVKPGQKDSIKDVSAHEPTRP